MWYRTGTGRVKHAVFFFSGGKVKLYTEREAAEILRVTPAALRQMRYRKRKGGRPVGPPWITVESRVRYPAEDLEDYLRACPREGES